MPEENLRQWTQRTLNTGRNQTAMGRAVQSGDAFYPDLTSPQAMTEFFNFLVNEVNSLGRIVIPRLSHFCGERGQFPVLGPA